MTLIETKAQVYRNKARTHTIIKSPYNERLIDTIKAIPGAKWYGDKKFWAVSADLLDVAKGVVRPFYQIEGEESQVEWSVLKLRVRFEQHKTPRYRKYNSSVMIDGTDLIDVDYGNLHTLSTDFDILESEGGFVQGDEHSAYWTVEYTLTVKMRKNATIETGRSASYEVIE